VVATLGERRSEALLCRRQPYSWYLACGREEALRCPPRASTHLESWLGLFTLLLARRHLPDPALDARGEALWQAVIPAMIDPATGAPRHHRARVPNTGYLISALVDRYEADGDRANLDLACRLAEAMLAYQGEDGGIYGSAGGNQGHVHYTCVCYPAKSLLELLQAVRPLASEPAWAARASRLEAALQAAMDDLVRRGDRIETEGEQTFEDGMIACAAAQLAAWALDRPDGPARTPYRDTAVAHALSHRCLEQQLIPDCRMRGATLRFWESQYDVRLYPNMFNSPHGWTSWTTYATWYLYLLTGEVAWLRQTMNALGACLQCVDTASGRLRWAFVPDPWVEYQQFGPGPDRRLDGSGARIFFSDPDRPASGEPRRGVLGEQYVELIGDRYPYWCCDNDVHEHFKCLAEVALTSAYLAETAPGVYETWNCHREATAAGLIVTPAEPLVTALHLNLRQPARVRVRFAAGEAVAEVGAGLHWLRAR
jgi:hypothetical protein